MGRLKTHYYIFLLRTSELTSRPAILHNRESTRQQYCFYVYDKNNSTPKPIMVSQMHLLTRLYPFLYMTSSLLLSSVSLRYATQTTIQPYLKSSILTHPILASFSIQYMGDIMASNARFYYNNNPNDSINCNNNSIDSNNNNNNTIGTNTNDENTNKCCLHNNNKKKKNDMTWLASPTLEADCKAFLAMSFEATRAAVYPVRPELSHIHIDDSNTSNNNSNNNNDTIASSSEVVYSLDEQIGSNSPRRHSNRRLSFEPSVSVHTPTNDDKDNDNDDNGPMSHTNEALNDDVDDDDDDDENIITTTATTNSDGTTTTTTTINDDGSTRPKGRKPRTLPKDVPSQVPPGTALSARRQREAAAASAANTPAASGHPSLGVALTYNFGTRRRQSNTQPYYHLNQRLGFQVEEEEGRILTKFFINNTLYYFYIDDVNNCQDLDQEPVPPQQTTHNRRPASIADVISPFVDLQKLRPTHYCPHLIDLATVINTKVNYIGGLYTLQLFLVQSTSSYASLGQDIFIGGAVSRGLPSNSSTSNTAHGTPGSSKHKALVRGGGGTGGSANIHNSSSSSLLSPLDISFNAELSDTSHDSMISQYDLPSPRDSMNVDDLRRTGLSRPFFNLPGHLYNTDDTTTSNGGGTDGINNNVIGSGIGGTTTTSTALINPNNNSSNNNDSPFPTLAFSFSADSTARNTGHYQHSLAGMSMVPSDSVGSLNPFNIDPSRRDGSMNHYIYRNGVFLPLTRARRKPRTAAIRREYHPPNVRISAIDSLSWYCILNGIHNGYTENCYTIAHDEQKYLETLCPPYAEQTMAAAASSSRRASSPALSSHSGTLTATAPVISLNQHSLSPEHAPRYPPPGGRLSSTFDEIGEHPDGNNTHQTLIQPTSPLYRQTTPPAAMTTLAASSSSSHASRASSGPYSAVTFLETPVFEPVASSSDRTQVSFTGSSSSSIHHNHSTPQSQTRQLTARTGSTSNNNGISQYKLMYNAGGQGEHEQQQPSSSSNNTTTNNTPTTATAATSPPQTHNLDNTYNQLLHMYLNQTEDAPIPIARCVYTGHSFHPWSTHMLTACVDFSGFVDLEDYEYKRAVEMRREQQPTSIGAPSSSSAMSNHHGATTSAAGTNNSTTIAGRVSPVASSSSSSDPFSLSSFDGHRTIMELAVPSSCAPTLFHSPSQFNLADSKIIFPPNESTVVTVIGQDSTTTAATATTPSAAAASGGGGGNNSNSATRHPTTTTPRVHAPLPAFHYHDTKNNSNTIHDNDASGLLLVPPPSTSQQPSSPEQFATPTLAAPPPKYPIVTVPSLPTEEDHEQFRAITQRHMTTSRGEKVYSILRTSNLYIRRSERHNAIKPVHGTGTNGQDVTAHFDEKTKCVTISDERSVSSSNPEGDHPHRSRTSNILEIDDTDRLQDVTLLDSAAARHAEQIVRERRSGNGNKTKKKPTSSSHQPITAPPGNTTAPPSSSTVPENTEEDPTEETPSAPAPEPTSDTISGHVTLFLIPADIGKLIDLRDSKQEKSDSKYKAKIMKLKYDEIDQQRTRDWTKRKQRTAKHRNKDKDNAADDDGNNSIRPSQVQRRIYTCEEFLPIPRPERRCTLSQLEHLRHAQYIMAHKPKTLSRLKHAGLPYCNTTVPLCDVSHYPIDHDTQYAEFVLELDPLPDYLEITQRSILAESSQIQRFIHTQNTLVYRNGLLCPYYEKRIPDHYYYNNNTNNNNSVEPVTPAGDGTPTIQQQPQPQYDYNPHGYTRPWIPLEQRLPLQRKGYRLPPYQSSPAPPPQSIAAIPISSSNSSAAASSSNSLSLLIQQPPYDTTRRNISIYDRLVQSRLDWCATFDEKRCVQPAALANLAVYQDEDDVDTYDYHRYDTSTRVPSYQSPSVGGQPHHTQATTAQPSTKKKGVKTVYYSAHLHKPCFSAINNELALLLSYHLYKMHNHAPTGANYMPYLSQLASLYNTPLGNIHNVLTTRVSLENASSSSSSPTSSSLALTAASSPMVAHALQLTPLYDLGIAKNVQHTPHYPRDEILLQRHTYIHNTNHLMAASIAATNDNHILNNIHPNDIHNVLLQANGMINEYSLMNTHAYHDLIAHSYNLILLQTPKLLAENFPLEIPDGMMIPNTGDGGGGAGAGAGGIVATTNNGINSSGYDEPSTPSTTISPVSSQPSSRLSRVSRVSIDPLSFSARPSMHHRHTFIYTSEQQMLAEHSFYASGHNLPGIQQQQQGNGIQLSTPTTSSLSTTALDRARLLRQTTHHHDTLQFDRQQLMMTADRPTDDDDLTGYKPPRTLDNIKQQQQQQQQGRKDKQQITHVAQQQQQQPQQQQHRLSMQSDESDYGRLTLSLSQLQPQWATHQIILPDRIIFSKHAASIGPIIPYPYSTHIYHPYYFAFNPLRTILSYGINYKAWTNNNVVNNDIVWLVKKKEGFGRWLSKAASSVGKKLRLRRDWSRLRLDGTSSSSDDENDDECNPHNTAYTPIVKSSSRSSSQAYTASLTARAMHENESSLSELSTISGGIYSGQPRQSMSLVSDGTLDKTRRGGTPPPTPTNHHHTHTLKRSSTIEPLAPAGVRATNNTTTTTRHVTFSSRVKVNSVNGDEKTRCTYNPHLYVIPATNTQHVNVVLDDAPSSSEALHGISSTSNLPQSINNKNTTATMTTTGNTPVYPKTSSNLGRSTGSIVGTTASPRLLRSAIKPTYVVPIRIDLAECALTSFVLSTYRDTGSGMTAVTYASLTDGLQYAIRPPTRMPLRTRTIDGNGLLSLQDDVKLYTSPKQTFPLFPNAPRSCRCINADGYMVIPPLPQQQQQQQPQSPQ